MNSSSSNKKLKISSTAYNVLFLLKLLLKNNLSLNTINNLFNQNIYIKKEFSREVILKYIRTLKTMGCNIKKNNANNKFYLNNSLINLKFDEKDIKALAIMSVYALDSHSPKINKYFDSFMYKLSKYISYNNQIYLKNTYDVIKSDVIFINNLREKYSKLIEKIEYYCLERNLLTIKYRNPINDESIITVLDPHDIEYFNNNLYLVGYNTLKNEKETLNLSFIQSIAHLPNQSKNHQTSSVIIFRIKDKLAQNYKLYPQETVIERDEANNTILIKNQSDNNERLLSRLMTYGDLCEITYPTYFRDECKKQVEKGLENYLIT